MAKHTRKPTVGTVIASAVLLACATTPVNVDPSVDAAEIESCLKAAYSLLTDRMRVNHFNHLPKKSEPLIGSSLTEFKNLGDGRGEWIDINADGSRRLVGKNTIKGRQVIYSMLGADGSIETEVTFNVLSCGPRGNGYEYVFTATGPYEPGGPLIEDHGVISFNKSAYRARSTGRPVGKEGAPIWTNAIIAVPVDGP